jgi:hypothetical protein
MNELAEETVEIVASVQSGEEAQVAISENFPYNSNHESFSWQTISTTKRMKTMRLLEFVRP